MTQLEGEPGGSDWCSGSVCSCSQQHAYGRGSGERRRRVYSDPLLILLTYRLRPTDGSALVGARCELDKRGVLFLVFCFCFFFPDNEKVAELLQAIKEKSVTLDTIRHAPHPLCTSPPAQSSGE